MKRHLRPDLQVAVSIAYAFGWRMQSEFLFPYLEGRHREQRVCDFRKAWAEACLEATLDLEGLDGMARTQRKAELVQTEAKGEKPGLLKMLRHDFRRTGVRNMVNQGVPERVAMKITGHKTRAVFDHYHIVSPGDLQEAARKLTGTFSGTLPDGAPESSAEVVEKQGDGW